MQESALIARTVPICCCSATMYVQWECLFAVALPLCTMRVPICCCSANVYVQWDWRSRNPNPYKYTLKAKHSIASDFFNTFSILQLKRLSMEQLKVQIDQMLNQLKQRSVGQSKADLFEMIGKLEQAKSYLLAEVVRPELHTSGSPSPSFFEGLSQEAVMQIPPAAQVSGSQQVELVGDSQVELIPQVAPVGGSQQVIPQAAPVGHAFGWKYLWDLSDEHLFLPMADLVPWFTTSLNGEDDQNCLHIGSSDLTTLAENSPQDFIRSKMFSTVGIPVTLKSSKLADGITFRTGLLINTRQGIGLALFWPLLGPMFPLHKTIELSFQWKVCGLKPTLLIHIDEKASEQVGTSKQATGRKRGYAD